MSDRCLLISLYEWPSGEPLQFIKQVFEKPGTSSLERRLILELCANTTRFDGVDTLIGMLHRETRPDVLIYSANLIVAQANKGMGREAMTRALDQLVLYYDRLHLPEDRISFLKEVRPAYDMRIAAWLESVIRVESSGAIRCEAINSLALVLTTADSSQDLLLSTAYLLADRSREIRLAYLWATYRVHGTEGLIRLRGKLEEESDPEILQWYFDHCG
jgi:hypothetical protein